MKKAIMNTMIILFALAMCVGCGQSSEQKEESVPTDVTKAEKQEQVQVEAEDEDTLENGEQVFRVVEVMPKFPGGDAELLKFIAKNVKYPQESQDKGEQGRVICSFVVTKDGTLTNYKVLRGNLPGIRPRGGSSFANDASLDTGHAKRRAGSREIYGADHV